MVKDSLRKLIYEDHIGFDNDNIKNLVKATKLDTINMSFRKGSLKIA